MTGRILTALWLAVILVVTLRSAPDQAARVAATSGHCISCGDAGTTDTLLNLLLFLPLGLGLRARSWRWLPAALTMLALSFSIECAQATLLVGRDATLGDLLANTLGGLVGWKLWPGIHALRTPPPRLAGRAAGWTFATCTVTWLLSAWSLQPALRGSEPWVGQPMHRVAGAPPFPARFISATLNGVQVVNDPLLTSPSKRNTVQVSLTLARTSAPIPNSAMPLLRVVDADQAVLVGVTSRAGTLGFDTRVRGSAWRLRTPQWLFPDVLNSPDTGAVTYRLRRVPSEVTLRVLTSGSRNDRAMAYPVTVGSGWIFIHPFVSRIGPGSRGWTLAWLAGWVGLVGWWAGWLSIRRGFGLVSLALLLYLTVGALAGLAIVPAEFIAAGAAGVVATLAAAWWRHRHHAAGE